jgi:hypothetical protein
MTPNGQPGPWGSWALQATGASRRSGRTQARGRILEKEVRSCEFVCDRFSEAANAGYASLLYWSNGISSIATEQSDYLLKRLRRSSFHPQCLAMVWGLDWITGSAPAQPVSTAPRSTDGGFVAPDRSKREVCYESRDIFFKCLDKNDILDAIKEDEKARQVCPEEVTAYERDCARSWVSTASNTGSGGFVF